MNLLTSLQFVHRSDCTFLYEQNFNRFSSNSNAKSQIKSNNDSRSRQQNYYSNQASILYKKNSLFSAKTSEPPKQTFSLLVLLHQNIRYSSPTFSCSIIHFSLSTLKPSSTEFIVTTPFLSVL
jgi:hypothetical protein